MGAQVPPAHDHREKPERMTHESPNDHGRLILAVTAFMAMAAWACCMNDTVLDRFLPSVLRPVARPNPFGSNVRNCK